MLLERARRPNRVLPPSSSTLLSTVYRAPSLIPGRTSIFLLFTVVVLSIVDFYDMTHSRYYTVLRLAIEVPYSSGNNTSGLP